MNKFDYEKTGYTEPTEEDEKRIFTEEYLLKDVFGTKVLMTTGREFNELYKTLPKDVHYFAIYRIINDEERKRKRFYDMLWDCDIRGCDDDPSMPATVKDKVFVNRCGSILSKEDLIAPERKTCNPNDNAANIPEEKDQEFMTISDFIHKDDEEFELCIKEIVHHIVKVKAKDSEEATILAAKKYIHDDNFCDTTTNTGSIDDVLISVKENSGPSAGEYAEFKDLYDYARDKINGKTVL
jgi:hypothetical protein